MEWMQPVGTACVLGAIVGVIGIVVLFRADARRESGHGAALAAMSVLGVMSPVLFLAGVVLWMTGSSDSFGR
jgi:hypothetical protein